MAPGGKRGHYEVSPTIHDTEDSRYYSEQTGASYYSAGYSSAGKPSDILARNDKVNRAYSHMQGMDSSRSAKRPFLAAPQAPEFSSKSSPQSSINTPYTSGGYPRIIGASQPGAMDNDAYRQSEGMYGENQVYAESSQFYKETLPSNDIVSLPYSLLFPGELIGFLIGVGGGYVREIENATSASLRFEKASREDDRKFHSGNPNHPGAFRATNQPTKLLSIYGSPSEKLHAMRYILKRIRTLHPSNDSEKENLLLGLPGACLPVLIGNRGVTIKGLASKTGCHILVEKEPTAQSHKDAKVVTIQAPHIEALLQCVEVLYETLEKSVVLGRLVVDHFYFFQGKDEKSLPPYRIGSGSDFTTENRGGIYLSQGASQYGGSSFLNPLSSEEQWRWDASTVDGNATNASSGHNRLYSNSSYLYSYNDSNGRNGGKMPSNVPPYRGGSFSEGYITASAGVTPYQSYSNYEQRRSSSPPPRQIDGYYGGGKEQSVSGYSANYLSSRGRGYATPRGGIIDEGSRKFVSSTLPVTLSAPGHRTGHPYSQEEMGGYTHVMPEKRTASGGPAILPAPTYHQPPSVSQSYGNAQEVSSEMLNMQNEYSLRHGRNDGYSLERGGGLPNPPNVGHSGAALPAVSAVGNSSYVPSTHLISQMPQMPGMESAAPSPAIISSAHSGQRLSDVLQGTTPLHPTSGGASMYSRGEDYQGGMNAMVDPNRVSRNGFMEKNLLMGMHAAQPSHFPLKFVVTSDTAAWIVGKGGDHVKDIKRQTGVDISVSDSKTTISGLLDSERLLTLSGTILNKYNAIQTLIGPMLGRPMSINRPLKMLIPTETVSFLIGARGATINRLTQESAAEINIDKTKYVDTSRLVIITGSAEAQLAACILLFGKVEAFQYPEMERENMYIPVVAADIKAMITSTPFIPSGGTSYRPNPTSMYLVPPSKNASGPRDVYPH